MTESLPRWLSFNCRIRAEKDKPAAPRYSKDRRLPGTSPEKSSLVSRRSAGQNFQLTLPSVTRSFAHVIGHGGLQLYGRIVKGLAMFETNGRKAPHSRLRVVGFARNSDGWGSIQIEIKKLFHKK